MVGITEFARIILKKYPSIKTNLRIAHNKTPPEKFVKRAFRLALYASLGLTLLVFFLLAKSMEIPQLILVIILFQAISLPVIFLFTLQSPKSAIRKRQRDIDKEVLFAGRYLLVKVESGTPLVNTINDASKTYGVSAKYFREIMDEIETGIPLETALENARTYNASKKFKGILWEIVTALKTGAEITGVLRSTLKTIAQQQVIEIKQYGKKLNSLMLFYMVIACVAPSLGVTMLVIISGFINLQLSNVMFYSFLFFLAVVQMAFLAMVKSARPMVEL